MSDWIATAIGLVSAGALLALGIGLVLSMPIVATQALQVFQRREWVPVIYNLRSLRQRKVSTAGTFGVLALVVFVLTAVMMFAQGIAHTLSSTGGSLNVKVVLQNASSEWASWMSEQQVQLLRATPGIAKDETGAPLVSPELVSLIWSPRADASDADDGANLSVRGVHPVAFKVHPASLDAGRFFATGSRELVIGRAVAGRFAGAAVGGTMTFADRDWTVVGIANYGGTAHDSELWGDIEVLGPTFRRGYSTATLALTERSGLDTVRAAMASNPLQSELLAERESTYWRKLSGNYVRFVTLLGAVVGLIFSFGAILGALNTMYAQVTARTRELGTLRAIGFKPRAILVSLVLESLLLSLTAGVVGVLAASVLGQGNFTLTNDQTLSEITYGFHLSPALSVASLGFALVMGYAGGLLPAVRAAQMRIVDAVRAD